MGLPLHARRRVTAMSTPRSLAPRASTLATAAALALSLATRAVSAQESPSEVARRSLIEQAERAATVRLFIAEESRTASRPLDAYVHANACVRAAEADASLHNREVILARCREVAVAVQARVARVVVRITDAPSGLRLRIGDAELPGAASGVSFPVAPGTVTVTASAEGFERFEREVTVEAGAEGVVEVTLRRAPEAPVTTRETTATHAAVPAVAFALPALREETSPSVFTRWWFWTGVAVVAVGAGVTGVVVANENATLDPLPPGPTFTVMTIRLE
jgi:hypothetical protein